MPAGAEAQLVALLAWRLSVAFVAVLLDKTTQLPAYITSSEWQLSMPAIEVELQMARRPF